MRNQWLPDLEEIIEVAPELYRFFPFNKKTLAALAEPYLWFSKIDDFNDAFEGHVNA